MLRRLTIAPLLVGLTLPVLALSSAPAQTRSVDVRQDHSLVVTNVNERVTTAGDVNGDGTADIAAAGYDTTTGVGRATVCVIFGRRFEGEQIDCRAPGEAGLLIRRSVVTSNQYNYFVASAGDVNADGLDDLVVGEPGPQGASSGHPWEWDRVYVVFGRRDAGTVDLTEFDQGSQGDAGFVVAGPRIGSLYLADGLPDVNGDGRDDLVVGHGGRTIAYVVFGKGSSSTVDLGRFHSDQGEGYRIVAPRIPERTYLSLSAVRSGGDVNGDDRGDVVLGLDHYSRDEEYAGPARGLYVAFGKASTTPLRLRLDRFRGFRLKGFARWDVDPAGDMDRDGRGDLVALGGGRRAMATVVFGKADRDPVVAGRLGDGGFSIKHPKNPFGWSAMGVASAADMNGDGRREVLVATEQRHRKTSLWVVYGRKASRSVELGSSLEPRDGFRMYGGLFFRRGEEMYSAYGAASFAGPGDMSGDGRGEVFLRATPYEAYLVWGR